MRPLVLTNAFLVPGDGRVLLGLKKRGFGAGKWNGFGGKLAVDERGEATESPLEGAQRELQEEAGVTMLDPQEVGRVAYSYEARTTGPDPSPLRLLHVHVFRATRWAPEEPRESEEMLPRWFAADAEPFDTMWADDKHWHPVLLGLGDTDFFQARFHFAADYETILDMEVRRCDALPPFPAFPAFPLPAPAPAPASPSGSPTSK